MAMAPLHRLRMRRDWKALRAEPMRGSSARSRIMIMTGSWISLSRGCCKTEELYRNQGDGTFVDVTTAADLKPRKPCQGLAWGDYDNDGFLDLFVTNPGIDAEGVGNANLLYHNNGDGTFTDRATEDGLALQDDNPLHLHKVAAWADYNNDGFLDIIVKDGLGSERDGDVGADGFHGLFKNLGNRKRFITVNPAGVQLHKL